MHEVPLPEELRTHLGCWAWVASHFASNCLLFMPVLQDRCLVGPVPCRLASRESSGAAEPCPESCRMIQRRFAAKLLILCMHKILANHRGRCACKASNCRRRAWFSRTRSSRERKALTIHPRRCRSDTIMAESYRNSPKLLELCASHSFCMCTTFWRGTGLEGPHLCCSGVQSQRLERAQR